MSEETASRLVARIEHRLEQLKRRLIGFGEPHPATMAEIVDLRIELDRISASPDPGGLARQLDELNTGTRPGTQFTTIVDGYGIWQPGVYENLDIAGRVTITGSNITLRNCRVRGDENYAVLIDDRHGPTENVVVENCTISNSTNGIAGRGLFRRNNIFNVDNGINVWAHCDIVENYIHDFGGSSSTVGHFDGVENNGASNIRIIGNRIEVDASQTSTIMLNNEFGDVRYVSIEDNFLAGAGYSIYCDNRKSSEHTLDGKTISIKRNTIRKGLYGYASLYTSGVVIDSSNKLI